MKVSGKSNDLTPKNQQEERALKEIFKLIYAFSEVDFSKYRKTTILRRINRRMNLLKANKYSDYSIELNKNPEEVENLFHDLLLSYTHFFRDPSVFRVLHEKVFPIIIKNRSERKPIRIWVPGCSTGEEVYSMAISLFEFMEQLGTKIPVQLFGTDLLKENIFKARAGLFSDKIREHVPKDKLKRFFDPTKNGLKVIKHIREMCVFAEHDLIQDPPFPYIDLISCRNTLIYFDEELQDKVIPRFHFSLNLDGVLMLGSSEALGKHSELFNILDKKSNLFKKRIAVNRPEYNFSLKRRLNKEKDYSNFLKNSLGKTPDQSNSSDLINKIILETYTPPGVLINNEMQIIQFVGDTSQLLIPESGEASLKLSNMLGNELIPELYVVIEEVRKNEKKVHKKNIISKKKSKTRVLDICVVPVPDKNDAEYNFLILFEKIKEHDNRNIDELDNEEAADKRIISLETELRNTKDFLRSIIQEKDEVNYDLWAANEEIMSTNEELQSVNEEMEAAKEELESGNEELLVLNEELNVKNQVISESEEKYRNLVERANDGICIIQGGKVKFANQRLIDLWGGVREEVIDEDFSQFVFPKELSKLRDYYSKRLKGEKVPSIYETILLDKKNSKIHVELSAGVISYQNDPANFIIVRDVSERKQMVSALLKSERKNEEWIANSPICTKILDLDFNLQFMSSSGVKDLKIDDITKYYGKPYPLSFYPKPFKILMKKNLKKAKETGKTALVEADITDINGRSIWYHSTIVPIFNENEQLDYLMVVSMDITKRKLAEEALIESEEKHRTLFETMTQGVVYQGANGEILSANKSAERILGLTLDQMLGLTSMDPNWKTINEDGSDLPGDSHPSMIALKTGRVVDNVVMGVYNPQECVHRWINVNATPQFQPGKNTPYQVYTTFEDITDKKLAEKEIEEQNEKFQKAFNLNPNTLAIIDINTLERLAVNDYFAKVVGYSKEELLNNPLGALGEIDREKVNLAIETVKQGKSIRDVEVILTNKDGGHRIMLYAVEGMRIGNRECMIVSGKDITIRREMEKALELNEQRLKKTANIAKVGGWEIDLKGNTHSWTKETFAIHELETNKAPDVDEAIEYYHPEDRPKVSMAVQHAVENGDSFDFEARLITAKRNTKWVRAVGSTIENNGELIGIQGMIQDITELKKSQFGLISALERAQESDRLKSAFLSNMSHEIRTPMNGILGFTSLLKEPKLSGKEKESYVSIIEKSGQRMLNTINDIIDISRIQAGEVELIKNEFSVDELLNDLYDFFLKEADEKGIKLIYKPHTCKNECTVVTDKHKLESILTNLLKNAIKFTDKGNVTFGCVIDNEKNELILYVKDTGIGIPANRIDHIFNRFEQADIDDKLAHQGSGLGLAISKSYAKLLGGDITVKSTVGSGTTFFFKMPYLKPEPNENPEEDKSGSILNIALKDLSIIIAEDDEVSISLFKSIFSGMFKNITYTKNGIETVQKCKEQPETELILMDIRMPNMNGYEATKKIREFNKDVIIIAQTAHALEGDRQKAIDMGCNDYIAKPIDLDTLIKLIEKNIKK